MTVHRLGGLGPDHNFWTKNYRFLFLLFNLCVLPSVVNNFGGVIGKIFIFEIDQLFILIRGFHATKKIPPPQPKKTVV